MIRSVRLLAVAMLAVVSSPALSGDTGAVRDGNWSDPATWTIGFPGAADNAYIGSTYPIGAATTAAVELSQNSSTGSVNLGNGAGTKGTLDLHGFTLTANGLILGQNGGVTSVLRNGGGTFLLNGLTQYGGSFSFAPGDVTKQLQLSGSATATTVSAGNFQGNYTFITSGATLNLGADFTIDATLQVDGTLNANGHAITAGTGMERTVPFILALTEGQVWSRTSAK